MWCGATGEYLRTTVADFERMMAVAQKTAGVDHFIAGIGAADTHTTVELGDAALSAGAAAVLLPAPHFFRYSQDDIRAYCAEVSQLLNGCVLLYNLPQFTNGFEISTVQELIGACPNIAGIKDSSGSLDILRALSAAPTPGISRIVGSDGVLIEAREEGVCDAVISGIAGVVPELIIAVGRDGANGGAARYREAAALLDEVLDQLRNCPDPWGLKWIAERRGMAPAEFGFPMSEARRAQHRSFIEWLDGWLIRAGSALEMAEALQ